MLKVALLYLAVAAVVIGAYSYKHDDKSLIHSDTQRYKQLAEEGYAPDSCVFFPGFVIASRIVGSVFVASSLCFLAAIYVFRTYAGDWPAALFALNPFAFWCVLGYSESLFVLLLGLVLLGWRHGWRHNWLLIGLATATRPVGVALVLAARTWRERILGCWGLAAFVAFQWLKFGDPLLFVTGQKAWVINHGNKLLGYLTLEPLWTVYVFGSPAYWDIDEHGDILGLYWWESCRFWNPIVWLLMLAAILVGWQKRWLNRQEITASLGLLLIPYFTKGYEYGMISHARFAMIVLPGYIVFAKAPKWLLWLSLPISVALMGLFAHEFFMVKNGCY